MKKTKLALSLSGGIDSSTCVLLLKRNKFYIECIFMDNWHDKKKYICSKEIDYINARRVCHLLNIKLNVLDFSGKYWHSVFKVFLKSLANGETPNPDVLCNKRIKFNILLFYVLKIMNLDNLSTGHYARIEHKSKNRFIKKSFDIKKDQTYFLNQVKNNVKKYILFPLANYSKFKVRSTGARHLIPNYNKKDSVGICFVGKNKFHFFIKNYFKNNKGIILSENNKFLGFHDGLYLYTIGQRKNLTNNYKEKYYVYKKNVKKNILYVTNKKLNYTITTCKIKVSKLNLISKNFSKIVCDAKIRHGMVFHKCLISKRSELYIVVTFRFNLTLISIGQYIVFYKNNICLGGGVITKLYL